MVECRMSYLGRGNNADLERIHGFLQSGTTVLEEAVHLTLAKELFDPVAILLRLKECMDFMECPADMASRMVSR